MRKLIFICLLFLNIISSQSQNGNYVCRPCDLECDKLTFSEPGICPHYKMGLVTKSDFEAQKRIINVLESNEVFNENVRSDLGRIHLARNVFSASKGYDLLKELNLGTLKDKELRVLVTQYYERDIAWVHREFADYKLEFENFWLPYVRLHFKEFEFGNYAIPHDYSQILNDPTLLTATKMNINNLNNTINAYKSALSTAIKLIDKLPD